MNRPIIGGRIDERFLIHRLRSTGIAGSAAAALALGLFLWHDLVDKVVHWDLFAIGAAFVVVKLAVLAWYQWMH